MFTGIVTESGQVTRLDLQLDSARLTVNSPLITASVAPGSSVAVSGVCVTVVDVGDGDFTVDVIGETLARTSLSSLACGGSVNLERPVPPAGSLDGHIVQGHVDGTGIIGEIRPADGWRILRITASPGLLRYLAKKGSVAVDGVSLTVSDVSPLTGLAVPDAGGWFEVSLIPETMARTTLGHAAAGDLVNIEVDVIAKYVERLLSAGAK
jgi:riboflavin synthase